MSLKRDMIQIKSKNPNTSDLPLPDEDEVKKYFTKERWDLMEDYEKTSFCNIMHNYLQMEALGLNPVKPLFMSRHIQPEKKPLLKRKVTTDGSKDVTPPKTPCLEKNNKSSIIAQNSPASSDVPVIEQIAVFISKEKSLSLKLKNIFNAIFEVYKQYKRNRRSSLLGKFTLLRRKVKEIDSELKTAKSNNEIFNKNENNIHVTHILSEDYTNDLNEINSTVTKRDVMPKQKEPNQGQFEQNNETHQLDNSDKMQPLKKQHRSVQTQTLSTDGLNHNAVLVFISSAGARRTEQPPDPKYEQPKNKREERQKQMLNKIKLKNCRCIQTQTAEEPESIEESVLVFFPKKKKKKRKDKISIQFITVDTEMIDANTHEVEKGPIDNIVKEISNEEQIEEDDFGFTQLYASDEDKSFGKTMEKKNKIKKEKGIKNELDKKTDKSLTPMMVTTSNDGQKQHNSSETGKIFVDENLKQIGNGEQKQPDKLELPWIKGTDKKKSADKPAGKKMEQFNERLEGEDDFGPDFGLEVCSSRAVKIQNKTDNQTVIGDWDDFDFKWSDELSPVKSVKIQNKTYNQTVIGDWDDFDFKWSDELSPVKSGNSKKKSEEIKNVNQNETAVKDNSEKVEINKEVAVSSSSVSVSVRRYPRRSVPVHYYKEDEILQDDEYLFCDLCDREYEGDCPIHGPHIIFNDNYVPITGRNDRALLTTPPILQVSMSKIPGAGSGVWTEVGLPPHARLGPYEGDKTHQPDQQGYSWMIIKDKKLDHYIAAPSTVNSNWMRFVNCARHESEQNLVAFQYKGQIYYRTVSSVPPKSELFVWYGKEYAEKLGISLESFKHPDSSHLKSLVFSCNDCNKSFTSPLYLDNHKKYCRGKKIDRVGRELDCKLKDIKSLATEINGEKMYCCALCQYKSNNCSSMKSHLVTHTGEKVFEGDECGKRFTVAGNLTQHKRIHSGENPYKCSYCSYSCTQGSHLKRHLTKHTGEKIYACTLCNYKPADGSSMKKHNRKHTGEKPYSCTECDYKTAVVSSMKRHNRKHTGEKPYGCTECDYKSADMTNMIKHKRTHTGEKPYSCTECDFKTVQKENLKRHMMTHTGEKPYSCTECDFKTVLKENLKRHMMTHTGEKPYSCTECDFKTVLKENLKRHMMTHTGEKPYSCTECEYRTAQKSNLKLHMMTHTGEKPYSCTECEYRTAQKSNLKLHMMTHTGEKPYSCTECEYRTVKKAP